MKGYKAKLDYTLKHNPVISNIFRATASLFFRMVGCFVSVDNKAILFSGLNGLYNDSPRSIYEKILTVPAFRGFKYYWALENPQETEIPGPCIKIKKDTWNYFMIALKCKYWIACVNVERSLHFKQKSTVYLNTWHGTPFKTIGNMAAGRNDFDFSHVDFFCVSGRFEKETFLKAFNINAKSMLFTGLPRNDELYHVTQDDVERLRIKLNIPKGKKVILYAPTWRDSEDGGKTYSLKPPINIDYWKKELSDGFVVLMRTHPYTNELLGIQFDNFVRDYSTYPKINELLIVADYLVSDYSAIMFDYSILEKPVFSFGYDYNTYKKMRGFTLDPGVALVDGVITKESELIKIIKNCDYQKECTNTKLFKEKYLEYGGKATDICIQKLLEKRMVSVAGRY